MNCLVFSGGAQKGIVYLGILKFLEEINIINDFECFYGTSVGAIMAVLISIGYRFQELEYLLQKTRIADLISLDNLNIETFLSNFGFYQPQRLYKLIRLLIEKKTGIVNMTFQQHFEKYNKKVVITGSCISEFKCYYFSVDNYPDMPINDALAISTCIPILFQPIEFDNKLFIDGAIYDNFPLHHASLTYDINDILGCLLLIDFKKEEHKIESVDRYLISILKSIDIKFNYLTLKLYRQFTITTEINETNVMEINNESMISYFIDLGFHQARAYYNENIARFFKKYKVRLNSIVI
jgi:predicted acylesterase/phospholipase RssA